MLTPVLPLVLPRGSLLKSLALDPKPLKVNASPPNQLGLTVYIDIKMKKPSNTCFNMF